MNGQAMVIDLDDPWPISSATVLPPPEGVLGLQPGGWTDDGRKVIVAGWERDETASSLFIFDLEQGEYRLIGERRLRMDFHYGLPVLLGDGQHLLFSNEEGVNILDIESGTARFLLRADRGSQFVAARMSRDMKSLFFLRLEEEADVWIATMDDPSQSD
jgi:hypothetical protein